MPLASTGRRRRRIPAIDGLRGLLILLMTFNHLLIWPLRSLNQIYRVSYQPLGFLSAAEGFFFLSGLVCAFAYGGLMGRGQSYGAVFLRLQKRAFKLYAANLLLTVCVVWLFHEHLQPMRAMAKVASEYQTDGWLPVVEILFNLNMPWLCDVLPLYILFMELTALILYVERQIPIVVMLLIMAASWTLGLYYPFQHLATELSRLTPGHSLFFGWFEPMSWQLIFGAGLIIGRLYQERRLPRWALNPPDSLVYGCAGVLAMLFVQRHFHIPLPIGVETRLSAPQVLGILRLSNFAALLLVVRRFWPIVSKVLSAPLLVMVGQASLAMFCLHVLIVYTLAMVLQRNPNVPSSLLVIGLVSALGLICAGAWVRRALGGIGATWAPLSSPAASPKYPIRTLHYLGLKGMTGVEHFVHKLTSAQKQLGLDTAITCHPREREELMQMTTVAGIPLHPFVSDASRALESGLRRKVARVTLAVRRFWHLYRQLCSGRYTVLHIHQVSFTVLPAYLAAILAPRRVRIVVSHHTTTEFLRQIGGLRAKITFLLEKFFAAACVMPYQQAANELIAAGIDGEKVHVTPFCTDAAKFAAANPAVGQRPDFNLLIAARLVPGKGHAELLTALAQVRQTQPWLRLTIAGDGPMASDISKQIQTLGLESAVTMAGNLSQEQMLALLPKVDAVVLPSYMNGETFPISLLEAAAAGLPAIATRWFGIPDIVVDGETGLLVEPRSVDDLRRALAVLEGDRERARQMGRNAQARALKLYAADKVADKYLSIYAQVTSMPTLN